MRLLRCPMADATLGREILGVALDDPVAFLVVRIVLDLLGRDERRATLRSLGHQFPRRKGGEALIAEHGHVDLAPLDELFDDRVGGDAPVYEGHAFGELVVLVDE